MSNSVFFKDNVVNRDISSFSEDKINALNTIANKQIKELLKDNDNLFVYSNNQNDKIENQEILNLNSSLSLNTNNIVGFIGVNDVQINIGSRFSEAEDKQYFIQYMLQKINKINLFDFKIKHDKNDIWEQLLYLMFPIFLKRAYNQGLYKIYQKRHYNDSNLKGRVEIGRHIKSNLPFIGNIAYSNKTLSYNNPLTQLIRHTVEFIIAKGFSKILFSDFYTNNAIQILREVTPNYSIRERIKIIQKNRFKVSHPFFTEYEPLRKICLQILQHKGITWNGSNDKIYGLLIDISWLWEEYLYTILANFNFIHPENKLSKNKLYLFENSKPLYPDFYHPLFNIVIDAKYKPIDSRGLNREDLYQVVTYMYRLKASAGMVLYPTIEPEEVINEDNMNQSSHGGEETLFLQYGIPIPKKEFDFNSYKQEITKSENILKNYLSQKLNLKK